MVMGMKTLKEITNEILSLKSVYVFCHVRPDGDTVGSAVALTLALRQKGVTCDIVCDGELPQKLALIVDKSLFIAPQDVKFAREGHIAVDVASEHLLGHSWGVYTASEKCFCIDHHPSNSRFAKFLYLETRQSATLIIHEMLKLMQIDFTIQIAEAILLGIITDTGNFMHDCTNSMALQVASEMVNCGANMQKIINAIFKTQSKERAQLYVDVLSKMRFYLQNKLAIITIKSDDLQSRGLAEDSTEGFVDYPLTIMGVEVAVSLLQTKTNLYRVSFRSRGNVDVNVIAGEFGGGGHRMASGCVVSGMYEEVVEKVVRAVDINIY